MQHSLGIDLGTTYSVIAVKGNVTLTDEFERHKRYLPDCDVTIIPSPNGNETFPSVFWVNPKDPDDRRIGDEAKILAQDGEEPIMFSKRSIGTNNPLRIGNLTFDAQSVARELLSYLKFCAEQALGESVSRAVITHPADFKLSQVQETREAGKLAGFDVSRDEQLIMEPVAAALAYTATNDRDPLNILTYDLGGGTFDVSVVERRAGFTEVKANEGNPVLGGYNFDRMLVKWILEQQRLKGRTIPYDEDNPADRSRRAHLLQYAETFKETLTSQRNGKMPLNLKLDGVLVDIDGNPVQVRESMNREQYAALIADYLDETIQDCDTAIAKAGMTRDDIDLVLLVGGSTYGQWVQERVRNEFQKETIAYEPDLCVAAGAAIQAWLLPPPVAEAGGLRLVTEAPTLSNLPEITIACYLTDDKELPIDPGRLQGATATLRIKPGGTILGPLGPNESGRFIFTPVDLNEFGPTQCEVVVSGIGLSTLEREFDVRYDAGGNTNGVSATLPKALFVKTVAGLRLIAAEGVSLPFVSEPIQARTVRFGERLPIEFIQGDTKVGEAIVENIPLSLPPGSPVILEISISGSNRVSGMASVQRKSDGSVVARSPIRFEIPRIEIPGTAELRTRYEELESHREQEAALTEDPVHRLNLEGKIKKLSLQLASLLGEDDKDRHEINEKLREFERLLYPKKSEMDPSESRMDALAEECKTLIDHRTEPDKPALRKQFDTAMAMAGEGRVTRNEKKWKMAYDVLGRLRGKLDTKTGGTVELPETFVIKEHYAQECDDLELNANDARDLAMMRSLYESVWRSECDAADKGILEIRKTIESVPDDAVNKVAHAQCMKAMAAKPAIEAIISRIRIGAVLG